MNISLDYQSRTPIYVQIVSQIERYVALDILKPDDQIPSIRNLAGSLGINPNTVKKAYDILENKKIIITISTKGTFISDSKDLAIENKIKELSTIIEKEVNELRKLGLTNEEIKKIIFK